MPPARNLVSTARRKIRLADVEIEYTLNRRLGRRGAGMKIDVDGVTVSTGVATSVAFVEAFLLRNADWIHDKLKNWTARRQIALHWHDGVLLPWRGGEVTLRRQISTVTRPRAVLANGLLYVATPDNSDAATRAAVIQWYKREAKPHLTERTFALAAQFGIAPPRVLLSSANARWGSCNSRREVRLSWRLMKCPDPLADYIILHELAHLRHMNHSAQFWAEVERMCPAYRERKRELLASDHIYRAF